MAKTSAQIGKTLIIKCILGYHIDQDPAPILVVQPTIDMAEAFSKDRLAPMIRDTPALRGKVADVKSRDSGNTILHKVFPGGHITMAGANSAASLASRPIRVALFDEVDRYPVSAGSEGDPVNLGKKRTATFWNRIIALFSTPTTKGASRIDDAYEASDQRRYFVPCPHCGHFHVLVWENVVFEEGHPEGAKMACPGCGELIDEIDKPRMLRDGRWEASAPFRGIAGFAISELYSPWRTWADMASDYEKAKGHPEQMKTFVNTSLGETYAETGEAPESQRLYDKRETYKTNTIPAGVVFLTMGVDVQGDRLELEIVGWHRDKSSHSVDYRVIVGDTSDEGPDGPWAELAKVIQIEQWETEAGPSMPLRYTCVDSGYRTTIVYNFCRKMGMARCAPTKGQEEQAMVISSPKTLDRRKDGKAIRGVKLYSVGVSVCKAELYSWLKMDKDENGGNPPGYCHFPEYELRYFKELTSEQLMIQVDKRGFPKSVWQKKAGVRNEPLDCRVYTRAAAAIVGMDRWKEKDWDALTTQKAKVTPKPKPATAPTQPEQPKQQAPQRLQAPPKRKKSSFI